MEPHELADVLGSYPPFDALDHDARMVLALASTVQRYAPGELILDAFTDPSAEVFVVLEGEVRVWDDDLSPGSEPDHLSGPGAVFGFSAMLSERSVGPRAVAGAASVVARIPDEVAASAFASRRGIQFIAADFAQIEERRKRDLPTYSKVEELIVSTPLIVDARSSVEQAAQAMSEKGWGYAAVKVPAHGYRMVTDQSLRRHVTALGRAATTPVTDALADHSPTLPEGSSAGEAMIAMLETGSDYVLITDRLGGLRGVVAMRDVTISPTTADVSMHQQLHRSPTVELLVRRARTIPDLLDELLLHGLSSAKVVSVYSTLLDTVMRRSIELILADQPDLPTDTFTWLSLGSNGRREAVLSSDVDSAVSFSDDVPRALVPHYRTAFRQVHDVLESAGLSSDHNGVSAFLPTFSRTESNWRLAARRWIAGPEEDNGAIMASLLADGRTVYGDHGLTSAARVLAELRSYPGSMRLLLQESLSHRAKVRSTRDALLRRSAPFDIKSHALLPIVNIARWAALSVGSTSLSTTGRLRDASGSAMLPPQQAEVLIEVFEVLQRIRLRYQLMQHRHGIPVSDKLPVAHMSPLDRSVVSQAVHEINALQRRMANVSNYLSPDQWTLPESP